MLFASSADLDEHLKRLEEAEKFDHTRIGRELDLFFFDPISPASPFFLPKGTTVYNLMTDFIRESYKHYEYQEVISPQIFSTELWKQSGHYENYATIIGINATPTFLIFDDKQFIKIIGAQQLETFQTALNQLG